MKRQIAALLSIGMLLSCSAPEASAEYEVTDSTYQQTDETYATREEAVYTFLRAIDKDTARSDTTVLSRFDDAGKITATYTREIAAAVESGYIAGYEDGSFRPKAQITRAEALVLLNRILATRSLPQTGTLTFFDTPAWAEADVLRLTKAGLIHGYGNGYLGASDPLTREQTALLADRAARLLGPYGDYYEYANETWLTETTLPEGRAAWSDVHAIRQDLMKEIGEIIYSLYRQRNKEGVEFPQGSSEQKIVDVFSAGGNTVYRDSLGLEPVRDYLSAIDNAKDKKQLVTAMAKLERAGFHGLIPLSVGVDAVDSGKYRLTFSECYTGMNVDMVQGRDAARVQAAYRDYLTNLFTLFDQKDAANRATAVTELCTRLAEASMPLEEHNEIETHYRVFDLATMKKIFSSVDISAYLTELGFSGADAMVVYDLPLAGTVNRVLAEADLSLLKDYLRAGVMDGAALYLNSDAFYIWRDYQDTLNGVESGVMPADYAVQFVEDLLGWDLAKLYTEAYTSAEDKAAVERITEEILATYQKQIKKNTWMSTHGKEAALKKLSKLQVRVGYPENMADYPDAEYTIRSTRDGGNLLEYRTAYCQRYFDLGAKRLKEGVSFADRKRWSMLPQTVNAMYEPTSNSITIPAGILRKPFYNPDAVKERNLGGIGSVIAHEISHAMDAVGSRFDENGNLKTWWQLRDEEGFAKICTQIEKAYGSLEVLPGATLNGKSTLSENLADLAGMSCILDAVGEGNPRLEEVFLGYASIWRLRCTEDYTRMMLQIDTHAPDKIRVNRVLANFDVFQNYYGLREEDGMYLPESERIQIWNR